MAGNIIDPFDSFNEGDRMEHTYTITEKEYRVMIDVFGDTNPLHTNDCYAQDNGYESKVMHGSLFFGFLSHFIGMIYPAESCLYLGSDILFPAAAYLNDNIDLSMVVKKKVESERVLLLGIIARISSRELIWAKGKVTVRVR